MADLQPSHGAQGLSAAACQQRDLHYVRDRRLDRGVRCACRRGPRRTRAIGWRRGRGLRGGVLWPGCVARITPVPPYRAALGPVSRVRPRRRRFYALRPEPFQELNDWMTGYRVMWEARLDRFAAELDRRRRTRPKHKEERK